MRVRASRFEFLLAEGRLKNLRVSPERTLATLDDAEGETTVAAETVSAEAAELATKKGDDTVMISNQEADEELWAAKHQKVAALGSVLDAAGRIAIAAGLIAVTWYILNRGSFSSSPMDFMRLRGSAGIKPAPSYTRFSDIAGVTGATQELQEVVEFLKLPDKYTSLGAQIPKGCLLVGPPGTGKTLLARAVAGEAGVPFYSISAPEFMEMFVGVGAARVRELFNTAQANAPCIVFIDEIDAIGRQRVAGLFGFFGGAGEREQTLNQLLDSMDGFKPNAGVVVLAATNRPDVLDAALLRRFSRKVQLQLPDLEAREAILRVIARPLKLAPDAEASLGRLARQTPGFSGASLRALLNEAAIAAATRPDAQDISAADLQGALEKLVLGVKKLGGAPAAVREVAAVHEAGRAVVGTLMMDADEIQSVSILLRLGSSLGATVTLPSEDALTSGFYSKSYLLGRLSTALGGRAAEELRFGPDGVTTSSADDLLAVSATAHSMVETVGLSRHFSHASLQRSARDDAEAAFAGRPSGGPASATLDEADEEVRAVVAEAYARAMETLRRNYAAFEEVSRRLLEQETLSGEELRGILAAHGAMLTTTLRMTAGEDDE